METRTPDVKANALCSEAPSRSPRKNHLRTPDLETAWMFWKPLALAQLSRSSGRDHESRPLVTTHLGGIEDGSDTATLSEMIPMGESIEGRYTKRAPAA
eukprot:9500612-Pyramimonas_sp.AAC.1